MARFYHLDRGNTLNEGKIIECVKHNDIACTDGTLSRELQNHCDFMFPNGVSKHGDQYFVSNMEFKVTEPTIELLFEYIRRSYYPDKPSRFESFFAVNNIEDIKILIKLIGENFPNYSVWEVECDEFFKADMQLLHVNSSNLVTSYFGHSYWRGETLGYVVPLWEYLLISPIKVVKKILI